MEHKDFDKAVLNFVDKYYDEKLVQRMRDAFFDVALDEKKKGDTNKTFCALAFTVAAFLKMCSELATDDERVSIEDYSHAFKETTDLFCYAFDCPEDEDNELES